MVYTPRCCVVLGHWYLEFFAYSCFAWFDHRHHHNRHADAMSRVTVTSSVLDLVLTVTVVAPTTGR